MPEEQNNMNIENIIEKAFDYFNRFVDRDNQLDSILLEEITPEDDGWIVAIGFNGKRQESTEPATTSGIAALAGFGSRTTKTVREVRHIYMDKEGSFKRMT